MKKFTEYSLTEEEQIDMIINEALNEKKDDISNAQIEREAKKHYRTDKEFEAFYVGWLVSRIKCKFNSSLSISVLISRIKEKIHEFSVSTKSKDSLSQINATDFKRG